MKTNPRSWPKWWSQWTPEEREKLKLDQIVIDAENADDMQKATDRALDITQGHIFSRKLAGHFMKGKKLKKQMWDLGIN